MSELGARCCQLVMVVAGVVLLFSGLSSMGQAEANRDARQGQIHAYQKAVSAWPNHSAIFAASSFFSSSHERFELSQIDIDQPTLSPACSSNGGSNCEFPSHDHIHFQAKMQFNTSQINGRLKLLTTQADSSSHPSERLAMDMLVPIVTWTQWVCSSSSASCKSRCNRDDGKFLQPKGKASTCSYYEILSEVCVVLEMGTGQANASAGNGWVQSTRMPGCVVNTASHGQQTKRHGAVMLGYKTVGDLSLVQGGVVHVRLTLRSSDDPWLVAVSLTDGSLNFGPTTHSQISIGVFCLCLAALIFLLSLYFFGFKWCWAKSQASDVSDDYRTDDDSDADEAWASEPSNITVKTPILTPLPREDLRTQNDTTSVRRICSFVSPTTSEGDQNFHPQSSDTFDSIHQHQVPP